MIKAIVTDIEGTTSSIRFVKEVLFPYARQQLPDFVRNHAEQEDVRAILQNARELTRQRSMPLPALIERMLRWIDEDKKYTALKALQGLIWKNGYQQGDFQGHIYADAEQTLREWHQQGLALFVYSSGSVQAQQLLFQHTEYGDLTGFFRGYFDTGIGSKKDVASYRKIADSINTLPREILFLSDAAAELDAAQASGWQTLQLRRVDEAEMRSGHAAVDCFTSIDLRRFNR